MASITITSPENDATVQHTFTACGTFSLTNLPEDVAGVNSVQSVVTQNGNTLDTRTYAIPSKQGSGPWSVEHHVPGTGELTDCTVTATLIQDGVSGASTQSADITIEAVTAAVSVGA